MKKLWLLAFTLAFPFLAYATTGTWTLYYSETDTVNGDGSVTITPTVSISGDDGGYCTVYDELEGYEWPAVMLNGNAWAVGSQWAAGGESGGGPSPVYVSNTFPNVTIPAGQQADLSFAGKVQGECHLYPGIWDNSPAVAFFDSEFSDGLMPTTPAGYPCFIGTTCPADWPVVFDAQTHWSGMDLDDQQAAQQISNPYQVEPINVNSQGAVAAGDCPTNQYAGYVKYVTNQVQYANGSAYAVSGLSVADTITTGSRHDLGNGTSTGSATTTGDGSFQDQYSVCSSACPGSTGETDALQNWTVNGTPLTHVNSVIYKCGSITIDGN